VVSMTDPYGRILTNYIYIYIYDRTKVVPMQNIRGLNLAAVMCMAVQVSRLLL
jgi:hypothetical protein